MLTEHQIERYSRQILLQPVGGAGQERLLATRVRAHGEGAAITVASRYLTASGVWVDPVKSKPGSFPVQDPGARREISVDWVLAEPPFSAAEIPGVLIGTRESRCGVWLWSRQACRVCVARMLAQFTGACPEGLSVVAGALGAWMLQRARLENSSLPWLGRWVDAGGTLADMAFPSCAHRR